MQGKLEARAVPVLFTQVHNTRIDKHMQEGNLKTFEMMNASVCNKFTRTSLRGNVTRHCDALYGA